MRFVFDSENKISIVIRICSYGCVGFSRNRDYLRVKYTGGHNVCEYVCVSLNMYTIMYVYGYIIMYMCLYHYVCVYHYICIYCVTLYIYICVCIIMYVYVLLYMYMCVSLYVCMHYYALGWPKISFRFKVEIKEMLFIFINHFVKKVQNLFF